MVDSPTSKGIDQNSNVNKLTDKKDHYISLSVYRPYCTENWVDNNNARR